MSYRMLRRVSLALVSGWLLACGKDSTAPQGTPPTLQGVSPATGTVGTELTLTVYYDGQVVGTPNRKIGAPTLLAGTKLGLYSTEASQIDTFLANHLDYITYRELVPGGPAGSSADAFAARLVEATGVLLLPSTAFGSGDSHFRIGLGRTDLPEAVPKLERFLDGVSGAAA